MVSPPHSLTAFVWLNVGSIPTPAPIYQDKIQKKMNENKTIEQKTAAAILEKPVEIVIGGKTYQAAPPSTATLILVSEAVSQLPKIALDAEKIVEETLSVAKDCRILGEIVAILILGAKNITEIKKTPQIKEKRYLWGLIRVKKTVEVEEVINRKEALAREVLEELSPRELNNTVTSLLSSMNIADFFGLTTFLTEVNLLHQRKVEN